jgi:hypothetical protein
MNKVAICLLAFTLMVYSVSAQDCNCKESFQWMVNIFENNDAGFQYVINKKGMEDYKMHTNKFENKAENITSTDSCSDIMNNWLKYFRNGHIGVSIKKDHENTKDPSNSDSEIRFQFRNEKTIDLTENELITVLERKRNINPIEGVWNNGNYTIGIIGDSIIKNKFNAFIIKADSVYWMPKQVKAELIWNSNTQSYLVNYLMRDHSKVATTASLNDTKSILDMNDDLWLRLYPEETLSKKDHLLFSFSKSRSPFVEKLSAQTVYLRIPSFMPSSKKEIDEVLSENDSLITAVPNLIIDIRNGTGGGDFSYRNILPYLYTTPFRIVGVDVYATELNANEFENYAKQSDDTSQINFLYRFSSRMKTNLGKYIPLFDTPYQIDTLEKVMPYPQRVAIICNEYNGSTDEQFLITAKQSYKVKVFGRPTGGMLDISNINEIGSPDGNFVLSFGMSKSHRIPNYCIDGVGIQPDFFIDDSIPEYNWIEYTRSKLEE